MKEHQIIIINKEGYELTTISCSEQESLLEALLRQGISYRNECSGRGTCGKCSIRLLDGTLEITPSDRKRLTQQQLTEGYRLACKAYPRQDCTIALVWNETEGYEIITEHVASQIRTTEKLKDDLTNANCNIKAPNNKIYGIAIDIGTTTLAFSLIDKHSKTTVHYHTAINSQRVYGIDVISRMKASNDGKKEDLQYLIKKDILEGIAHLASLEDGSSLCISDIVIAGNTTMLHLLLGYSCEKLGVYPFESSILKRLDMDFDELFPLEDNRYCASDLETSQLTSPTYFDILTTLYGILNDVKMKVTILPGISTYVGGDILSGLYACGIADSKEMCLLIDLGTNGEMAVGNKERILVTSTAAGPAFEGGNITCGVGSVCGAISHVTLEQGKINFDTIGGKAPVGICGTGVIETAAELLKEGMMDGTGLLASPYFEDGITLVEENNNQPGQSRVYMTQGDIRELQLAKGAVRAGIEQLLVSYGITYDGIERVYLAGGFGFKLNIEKAIEIGLLPEHFRGKVIAAGNTSLAGATKYLLSTSSENEIEAILSITSEIHLADAPDFQELFIQYMNFSMEVEDI